MLFAFLGSRVGGFNRRWTEMQKRIAEEAVALNSDILDQNLREELMFTKKFGCKPKLSIPMDCGWLKRGGGKKYNANSGQHVTVGNHRQTVLSVLQ